ncbi:MAG: hypothetical protein A3K19_31125 [Lentisphaerae bacterium RIFOXYB12_FULL_65_16]|nr:MAG: hypothetical protein A3K18_26890 [Lentisphaerae bacterium RIFOXYA12_64_32]OGV88892.1 MAG: hypothetical protein A3K19_31125 [Lentisphaerae bacterium RIFOXYB12_FULL_65_16]
MIVRCYSGNSLERVREVIQSDLGEHAVIVTARKSRRKGWLPGLGRTVFEVTAVADEPVNAENPTAGQASGAGAAVPESLLETQKVQYRGLRQSIRLLDEKLVEIDGWMEVLASRCGEARQPAPLQWVHPEWQERMRKTLASEMPGRQPHESDWIGALGRLIPTVPGLELRRAPGAGPRLYVLIGCTGVGKTTTLAKLAARGVLGNQLKVGVITLDTFRIAGVEQLRQYANLLGIELAVAFSPLEFRRAVERFASKDMILVDTPGRGQFDSAGIAEIRNRLGGMQDLQPVLLVPANIRRSEVPEVLNGYGALSPARLIITKSDEAGCTDGLTRLFDLAGVPAAYITTGQSVPEDIQEASPALLVSLCCRHMSGVAPHSGPVEPLTATDPVVDAAAGAAPEPATALAAELERSIKDAAAKSKGGVVPGRKPSPRPQESRSPNPEP